MTTVAHPRHRHPRPARHTLAASLVLAATLTAAPAAWADEVEVTKAALVIDGGQRFFRGKASDVALGSYGQKKLPATAPNYLAVERTISPTKLAKIRVKVTGPIEIDWSKVSKTSLAAGAGYLTAAGARASLTLEHARSARLVLVKLSIAEGELKDLLNLHATDARAAMKAEGLDARSPARCTWSPRRRSRPSSAARGA